MADVFERNEVGSIYVSPTDRFVVSLVVGYDRETGGMHQFEQGSFKRVRIN